MSPKTHFSLNSKTLKALTDSMKKGLKDLERRADSALCTVYDETKKFVEEDGEKIAEDAAIGLMVAIATVGTGGVGAPEAMEIGAVALTENGVDFAMHAKKHVTSKINNIAGTNTSALLNQATVTAKSVATSYTAINNGLDVASLLAPAVSGGVCTMAAVSNFNVDPANVSNCCGVHTVNGKPYIDCVESTSDEFLPYVGYLCNDHGGGCIAAGYKPETVMYLAGNNVFAPAGTPTEMPSTTEVDIGPSVMNMPTPVIPYFPRNQSKLKVCPTRKPPNTVPVNNLICSADAYCLSQQSYATCSIASACGGAVSFM